MSLLADALQPFLVTELSEVHGRQNNLALTDLLIDPKSSFTLSVDNTAENFTVDFRDRAPVLVGLAADCNRFATAAFQTMVSVPQGAANAHGLPWSLIQLYYSAFYAGHTTIRLLGEACCFLDARHSTRITDLCDAIGIDLGFAVSGGTYSCIIARDLKSMTFSKVRGRQANTHESFWKLFNSRLDHCTKSILSAGMPQRDAQAAFDKLTSFIDLLKQRGRSESWLSSVRNEIQYRQSHEVWFPSSINKAARGVLTRQIDGWSKDPMTSSLMVTSPLPDFIAGCNFVIALSRLLLARVSQLSGSPQCFLNFGPENFCVLK